MNLVDRKINFRLGVIAVLAATGLQDEEAKF